MRSTLALLLLFGPAIVAATTCELYKLPTAGECTIDIEWRVHNDKQALATCLEYFPTTFVKGVKNGDKTKCTVKAAYTCVETGHFLMYDKCYYFPETQGVINKKKISEYVKMDATTKRSEQCAGGRLAAVYSSTHAKFLGMEANRRGIDKLGIGMTTDGMTIDEENGKKSMLHKNMWKLIEGDYWEADKLVKNPAYPAEAKYLFMRTRTDHMRNRIQGSFERATSNVDVTFACEFDSVFLADQEWYCNKLPALGIDAVYDKTHPTQPRCLYVTAGKYTWNGEHADMKNIKGCQERPSTLHSVGLDDGTAKPDLYGKLANQGPLRLAGFIVHKVVEDPKYNKVFTHERCSGDPTDAQRPLLFQKWRYLDHHGKIQYASASSILWTEKYPRNECSDFPGDSATLGVRKGKKIDMPREVRARAVCSLRFFQTCENDRPCSPKQECTNTPEFQRDTNNNKNKQGFFKCSCPGPIGSDGKNELHDEETKPDGEKVCKWKSDAHCAWMRFFPTTTAYLDKNSEANLFVGQFSGSAYNDLLQQVVVRDGCKMTIFAHGSPSYWKTANFELLHEIEYGTHSVPNQKDDSLAGEWAGMGASLVKCSCQ